MMNLIEKYNRQGPRYTSYPPVPFWKKTPTPEDWAGHIASKYEPEKGIDLYVHVPYCEKLCYYCGCNRTITKNHSVEDPFVQLIKREWTMHLDLLKFSPLIHSIHFGGGTPTFLSANNLDILLKFLTKNKSPKFKGSIEIDPRTVNEEHLDCFKKNGIERVSLGIQDFDPLVQAAINRNQSYEMVKSLMTQLRKREFESINFDIIYGLPKQTTQTIRKTFELVNELKPDLIAYYSYAHLPDRIKNQKLINTESVPVGLEKQELYELGKILLKEKGYIDIGMDHFARPGNFLLEAKLNQNLFRNFMGYVDKKSEILIGLGPSSISSSSISFIQNIKEFSGYEREIQAGRFAFHHGHTHSNADLKVQKIITDLMCCDEVVVEADGLPYWSEISKELEDFKNDGILDYKDKMIKLLPEGKKFVRNIAMSFDFHFRESEFQKKFSQTI